MENNLSNTQLLYEILDTLTDEEFEEFLQSVQLPQEKVDAAKEGAAGGSEGGETPPPAEGEGSESKEGGEEVEEGLTVEQRKQRLQERINSARAKQRVQERIQQVAAPKNAPPKPATEAQKQKIQERMQQMRNQQADQNDQLRAKVMEKLTVARSKKKVQERIASLRQVQNNG